MKKVLIYVCVASQLFINVPLYSFEGGEHEVAPEPQPYHEYTPQQPAPQTPPPPKYKPKPSPVSEEPEEGGQWKSETPSQPKYTPRPAQQPPKPKQSFYPEAGNEGEAHAPEAGGKNPEEKVPTYSASELEELEAQAQAQVKAEAAAKAEAQATQKAAAEATAQKISNKEQSLSSPETKLEIVNLQKTIGKDQQSLSKKIEPINIASTANSIVDNYINLIIANEPAIFSLTDLTKADWTKLQPTTRATILEFTKFLDYLDDKTSTFSNDQTKKFTSTFDQKKVNSITDWLNNQEKNASKMDIDQKIDIYKALDKIPATPPDKKTQYQKSLTDALEQKLKATTDPAEQDTIKDVLKQYYQELIGNGKYLKTKDFRTIANRYSELVDGRLTAMLNKIKVTVSKDLQLKLYQVYADYIVDVLTVESVISSPGKLADLANTLGPVLQAVEQISGKDLKSEKLQHFQAVCELLNDSQKKIVNQGLREYQEKTIGVSSNLPIEKMNYQLLAKNQVDKADVYLKSVDDALEKKGGKGLSRNEQQEVIKDTYFALKTLQDAQESYKNAAIQAKDDDVLAGGLKNQADAIEKRITEDIEPKYKDFIAKAKQQESALDMEYNNQRQELLKAAAKDMPGFWKRFGKAIGSKALTAVKNPISTILLLALISETIIGTITGIQALEK